MRSGIITFGAALLLLTGCAGAVDDNAELNDPESTLAQEAPADDETAEPTDPVTPADPTTPPPADPTTPPPADPTTPPPAVDATKPTIPEVTGACPTFRSGTATIGGLRGISMQVGAKKQGTGSIVFYWHGTGSGSFESGSFGGTRELLAQGGILVAPSGSLRTGGDCSGTATFSKDDFKVMDLIYACAVKEHGIDPRRAYSTGCSAGGLQAGCMATVRSSYIAAAAPNSGGIVFPQQIQNRNNIPAIMTMHGGPLDVVIVTFSQTSATLNNQISRLGGEVVNCNHGGGHCGASGTLQAAAWRFMKDHPFGAKPYGTSLPSGYPNYCKIWTPSAPPAGGGTRPGAGN